jgi:hypothetical protein
VIPDDSYAGAIRHYAQPQRAAAGPMFSATDAEFGLRPRRVKRVTIGILDYLLPKRVNCGTNGANLEWRN